VNLDTLLLGIADGISYAGLLFLISLGLTLIFGVLGVLNITHGSLYAFGGYTAASISSYALRHEIASTPVLMLALIAAAVLVGIVMGLILEVALLRHFQNKDPVIQLLVTFAAFMIFEDVQKLIWGTSPYSAGEIVTRMGTVDLFGVTYTLYQILVIPAIALLSYLGLNFFLKKTTLGKQTVAITHHREMAMALGVNVKKIATLVFVLGAIFGALGGALAVPVSSLSPGIGAEMIVVSFTVVATAGLGQITGALITSLMIGMARSLAVYLAPELEVAMPYIIMLIVLLVRPNGLFKVAQARRI
jgi:branched-chain amino acid transport system permease protein